MKAATFLFGLTAVTTLAACQNANEGSMGDTAKKLVVGGTTKQIRDVQPSSGFLPRPELLNPGGSGQAALVYRDPGVNFASYTRVILDPVIIRAADGSQLSTVPAEQRRVLAEDFYSDLYKALSSHCNLVRAPGRATLRIRIALVDTELPNAPLNTVATYAPYVSTAYSVATLAFNKGVSYFAGTATVEGFARDAKTGTLLWEAVDKRGGTGALVKNTFDKWVDVNHAFEDWSQQLATKMQQLGMCAM